MKKRLFALLVGALVALALAAGVAGTVALWAPSAYCEQATAGADEWQQRVALFDYDTSQSLNVAVTETAEGAKVKELRIEFDSPKGGRVAGLLLLPKDKPHPYVVLFLHGLGGSKKDARIAGALLAPKGIAVLGLDAALHGDRKHPGAKLISEDSAVMVQGFIQTVIDYRRAIDYLQTRDDVQAEKVGLIGASMGAIMGSMLAAVDSRVAAALLIVGGGDWVTMVRNSDHPAAEQVRQRLGDEEMKRRLGIVDPVNYVGHISPRPVWMLNGRDDRVIPAACAEALHRAAKEPKNVIWYDGGHIPPPAVVIRVLTQWLNECLLPRLRAQQPELQAVGN